MVDAPQHASRAAHHFSTPRSILSSIVRKIAERVRNGAETVATPLDRR